MNKRSLEGTGLKLKNSQSLRSIPRYTKEVLNKLYAVQNCLLLSSPKKVGYSIRIEFISTHFNSICKRCPCLELPICRICSENDSKLMKLIRGFLAYFMWIRWMEEIGGDVRDSGGALGPAGSTSGPRDQRAASRCHQEVPQSQQHLLHQPDHSKVS